MRDPKQYSVQTVHVNFARFQPGITGKQALLSSPQCRMQAQSGWQKVTLAEFLPLAQTATNASPAPLAVAAQTQAKAPRTLRVGDRCPVCGAEVRQRPLFNGSYIGCLCG
jgi:hypothetical protein